MPTPRRSALWDMLWAAGREHDVIDAGRIAFQPACDREGVRSLGPTRTAEHCLSRGSGLAVRMASARRHRHGRVDRRRTPEKILETRIVFTTTAWCSAKSPCTWTTRRKASDTSPRRYSTNRLSLASPMPGAGGHGPVSRRGRLPRQPLRRDECTGAVSWTRRCHGSAMSAARRGECADERYFECPLWHPVPGHSRLPPTAERPSISLLDRSDGDT